MSLKDLAHKVSSLVVEDDGTDTKPVAKKPTAPALHPDFAHFTTATSVPTFGAAAAAAPSPFTVPSAVPVDESVYQTILSKTNFDDTPVGKTIHGYYDGLEDMDPTSRFKTAFKLAMKRDNITADQVLGTFDQLQATLDSDGQKFQTASGSFEAREITARQNKIADLQAQLTQINQQISQLQGELTDQSTKHANLVTQYGLATQRRATEIAQQKASISNLLTH